MWHLDNWGFNGTLTGLERGLTADDGRRRTETLQVPTCPGGIRLNAHPLTPPSPPARGWGSLPVRLVFFSQLRCVSCAPPTSTNCRAFWRNRISLSLSRSLTSLSPSLSLTASVSRSFSLLEIDVRLARPLLATKRTAAVEYQLFHSRFQLISSSRLPNGSFVSLSCLRLIYSGLN